MNIFIDCNLLFYNAIRTLSIIRLCMRCHLSPQHTTNIFVLFLFSNEKKKQRKVIMLLK